MQSRNQLLLLSKKELFKLCKKRNLNTTGCLAKMDLVKLLLQPPRKKSRAKSNAKKPKPNVLRIPNNTNKRRRKKKKNLSWSEPIPMPSEVDPEALDYQDDDDEEPQVTDNKRSVQFNDLPWQMDQELKLKKEDSLSLSEEDKKKQIQRKISAEETSHSPRTPSDFVTIRPGLVRPKSLKTVFHSTDLKEPGSDDDDDDHEDDIDEDIFEQIDNALGDYYKSFERKDYYNDKGEGKFLVYCKERALDNVEEFEKYFGSETDLEPIECKYLDFDSKFPLNEYAPLHAEEEYSKEVMIKIEIYNVVEYCFHHKKSPY